MADSSPDSRWWRGFALFWGVLAILAAISRAWQGFGMALLFTTGFLGQEVRAGQQNEPRIVAPKLVAFAVVAAALGAAGFYLILRFQFHIITPWWGAFLLFLGLLLLYVAGPRVTRSFRRGR